jgi:hypothetical protein
MADFLKILLYLETSLTPYFCLTTTSVLSLGGGGVEGGEEIQSVSPI